MNLTADFDLKDPIRTIPDYPKPGIMFRDITTLLGHATGFARPSTQLVQPSSDRRVQRRGHRGARLHPGRRGGAPARLRLRADPQEGQAAGQAIGQDYRSNTAST